MHTRVIEPRQLTVLVTSKCTAACAHCCMNSSPERDDTLTWEQLERILTQALTELDLRVIIFAGGEPMLLGETLYRAIRLCKQHGRMTRIVTNAYWAGNRDHALLKLKELRAAGLDELNISTDDYHDPYISFDHVRNAYEVALTLDFSAVVLANCYGPNSTLTPDRLTTALATPDMQLRFDDDGQGKSLVKKKGKTLVVLSNSPVQRLGRGIDQLPEEDFPSTPIGQSLDELADAIGGCPHAIRSAAISAKGHLLACCGFELEGNPILDFGDLAEHSMAELLDRADDDLCANLIAILGPVKVMRLLQKICPDEVSFPRNYRSYCEACADVVDVEQNRRALYRHMDDLAPLMLQARDILRSYRDKGIDGPVALKVTLSVVEPP